MTSTRLRHALAASGYRLEEEEVSQAIARHPAFTERSDGAHGIGRRVEGQSLRYLPTRPGTD